MSVTPRMDPKLEALLREANATFASMTPEEQKRARREQAISFTWGQLALMKGGERLTREQIGELYDAREELRRSQGLEQ
jgi:hypothetical protein